MRTNRRCHRLLWAVAAIAAVLVAGMQRSSPGAVHAQSGFSVTFHAGYNLIAVPGGTPDLGVGALFHYRPERGDYEQLTQQGAAAGAGYWAAFDQDANVQLGAGSQQAATFSAGAGSWVMIGDPSGDHFALVRGADAVFTYDPQAGYVQAPNLQPGQGAWALVGASGQVSVVPVDANGSPLVSAAPAPSPTPPSATSAPAGKGLQSVSSPHGYRFSVPAGWQAQQATTFDLSYASPDGRQTVSVIVRDRGQSADAVAACTAFVTQQQQTLPNALVPPFAPLPQPVSGADSGALCLLGYPDSASGGHIETIVTAIRAQSLYILIVNFTADFQDQNDPLELTIAHSFALTTPGPGSAPATSSFGLDSTPAGSTTTPASSGFRSVISPRGYRLVVPTDWQAQPAATFDQSYASPDGQQTVSVLVRDRGQDSDGIAACRTYQAQFAATLSSSDILSAPTSMLVRGAESGGYCGVGYLANDSTARLAIIVAAVHGPLEYLMVVNLSLDYLNRKLDLGRAIVRSFELTGIRTALMER